MLEQELKLTAADAQTLSEVLESNVVRGAIARYGSNHDASTEQKPQRFKAKYYDTVDGVLEEQKASLRARREGDRMRAAFKLAGTLVDGFSQREEYEEDIDDWLNTIGDVPDGDLRKRVGQLIGLEVPLLERVIVDMQRQIRMLSVEGSTIELVADQGVIKAGGHEQQVYEIELELKAGSVTPLLAFGEQLQGMFFLTPSVKSKHGIGAELLLRP